MRWHAGVGESWAANNKMARLLNDMLQPKTHTGKLWEIYSKIYYEAHIKDSVPAGSNIIAIRQRIEEALKNEPQEVIDELKLEQAKQRASLRKGSSDNDNIEVDPLSIRKLVYWVFKTILVTDYNISPGIFKSSDQCSTAC